MVLSMPKGTDEKGVYDAAKEFAEEHFKDHKYMLVQHTFTNDPSKDPSENPHVHVVVKAVSEKGDRLNIRKADLQEWRESFIQTFYKSFKLFIKVLNFLIYIKSV
ncbi:hypothetical protein AB0862_036215 (plasmid) [Acinetobacter baumannii]